MGRKANTIYQDLEKLVNYTYENLQERALQENKNIKDYSNKEILDEVISFKDMFNEGGTVYDLYLEDKEDLSDSEVEDWNALHREYKDLCKFIDKWSSNQQESLKRANGDKITGKKEILKTLEKGTKINISQYGIVELIQVNRTRFYAMYKGQEWSFPIENFIGLV